MSASATSSTRGACSTPPSTGLSARLRAVEALEPWLVDARPAAEAAILAVGPLEEELDGIGTQNPDAEGAVQMFIEMGIQCDLVDAGADLSSYELVVLPDGTVLDTELKAKLDRHVAGGGALIFSGTAGLDAKTNTFGLAEAPASYNAPVPTIPGYIRPTGIHAPGTELADDYDYAFYEQAHVVTPLAGTESVRRLAPRLFQPHLGSLHGPPTCAGRKLPGGAACRTQRAGALPRSALIRRV